MRAMRSRESLRVDFSAAVLIRLMATQRGFGSGKKRAADSLTGMRK